MSLAASPPAPPSGLEQLRSVMFGDRPYEGIGRTLGFTAIEVEEGRVVFGGDPGPNVYNPLGTVHGGYAATLLDSACGCAVHSKLAGDQGYTTLELKVAYHRAMTAETGPVRAEGKVVTLGRRAAFAEATLKDGQGRLLASATSTLLIFQR